MAAGAESRWAVEDRLDLLDLVGRYADAVDNRDVDGVVALFTVDGRLEFVSSGQVATGHAEIQAFFETAFTTPALGPGTASTHVMSNTTVTALDADEAALLTEAVAYLATTALVTHAAEEGGVVLVRGLTYTDRCRRVEGEWRLAERIHRLHWHGQMPGRPE